MPPLSEEVCSSKSNGSLRPGPCDLRKKEREVDGVERKHTGMVEALYGFLVWVDFRAYVFGGIFPGLSYWAYHFNCFEASLIACVGHMF